MDEAAIDGEVSAGDVASPVASEQQCEVGDFLGPGEASGGCFGGRVCGDVAWFDSGGLGDRLSHTVVPSQSAVSTGPGLMVLTRIPEGPSSFDKDLQKLVRAALDAE